MEFRPAKSLPSDAYIVHSGLGRETVDGTATQLLIHARVGRRLYPRGGFDGLEPAELQVVVALWQQPNATAGDLARLLALSHSSVSNALRHLRERHLVGEGGERSIVAGGRSC